MPTDTRQKLIDAAQSRFYNDGFRNVGLDAILADVGISKTAFYKHFESKEQLMLEVLNQNDRWLRDTFHKMIRERGGRTAVDQLRGVMDVVQRVIEFEGFHGCIFVNAAMEFPLCHDPAHEAAARNKRAIEDIVHDIAERAGIERPQDLAEELCLVIEGAYVTYSVTRNRETIDIARRLADQIIGRHLAERTKPVA